MRKTDESQTSTINGSSYGRNGCVWKVETRGSLYGSNHIIIDHRQQQYQYYNHHHHDHVPQHACKTPPGVAYSVSKSYNNNRQSTWAKNERESKRQRRIAKYNTYTVESKVKSSIRNSFRWFKSKCGA